MRNLYNTEEELELEIIRLKQCVRSRDFKQAAKVAARISSTCKHLKPEYDYSCSLGEFDRILKNLSEVNYGVGGTMPQVVW
jgi:hypothetical protein